MSMNIVRLFVRGRAVWVAHTRAGAAAVGVAGGARRAGRGRRVHPALAALRGAHLQPALRCGRERYHRAL